MSLDSKLADALRTHVTDHFDTEQIPWLARLVSTPSYTLAPVDVERAAAQLDEMADDLELDTEFVTPLDERFARHRIYRTRAAAAGAPAWALVGHVDTVFPRSTGFLTFFREDGPSGPNDSLRGPGVLDMKSGLSVAFFGMRAVAGAAGIDTLHEIPLAMVVVSEEERGSPDSARLWPELAPSLRGALVFEAGRDDDRIVVARKGTGTFEVEFHGVSAHSGNHHAEGVNAIHAAALAIDRIEALTDYERGITVNVGTIAGGISKNTVPETCSIAVDVRLERAEDEAEVVAALRAIAADPAPDHPRLSAAAGEVSGRMMRAPMEASEGSEALRAAYEPHAEAAGLRFGPAPLQGGGSDANLIAARGVPCIDGLGPYGKGFHKRTEWCSATSLRKRTQAMATFLASLANA